MTLVDLVPDHAVLAEDAAIAESGRAQYGQLLQTWRAILNRPGLLSVYLPFLRAVSAEGTVAPPIKDLSALLVGSLNGCRYTMSHRYAAASQRGAADELVRRVIDHDWDGLPEDLRLVLEVTEHLTADLPSVSPETELRVVPGALLERLSERFDDAQVVELTMSIAVWNALSRFHRVMGFDLDMPPVPAGGGAK